jgi:hypothetical protein
MLAELTMKPGIECSSCLRIHGLRPQRLTTACLPLNQVRQDHRHYVHYQLRNKFGRVIHQWCQHIRVAEPQDVTKSV